MVGWNNGYPQAAYPAKRLDIDFVSFAKPKVIGATWLILLLAHTHLPEAVMETAAVALLVFKDATARFFADAVSLADPISARIPEWVPETLDAFATVTFVILCGLSVLQVSPWGRWLFECVQQKTSGVPVWIRTASFLLGNMAFLPKLLHVLQAIGQVSKRLSSLTWSGLLNFLRHSLKLCREC